MRSTCLSLLFLIVGCSASNPPTVVEAFAAVDANNSRILQRYLSTGGDPNARASNGYSMLYVATGPHGGEAVLRLLLSQGANPNIGSGNFTPLMNASSWCWLQGVQLLVKSGADIHLRNERGQTAMETVCAGGGDP